MAPLSKPNFKVLGISHIGIALEAPEVAQDFCKEVLGLAFEGKEHVLSQQTQTIMYALPDDSRIELLVDDKLGPIKKFLEKRGSGIHHIALKVDSVEAAIKDCLDKGIQMIDEIPRPGTHNTQIAFVHPKATGGFLLEFVQQS